MTKERLKRYRHIKEETRQIKDLLEELEARVYGLQSQELSDLPRAHTAKSGSAQERAADSSMQLRERYRAKLEELAEEQLAIEEAIEALEPTQRQMLRYKYIEGMTWEEVCVAMNYSWRQVHRLHAKALKQLA